MIRLILLLDKDYYKLSGTMLSPVVHDRESAGSWDDPNEVHEYFERCDWGKIHLAIEAGLTVAFRAATQEEIESYTEKLKRIRHNQMENSNIDMSQGFPTLKLKDPTDAGMVIKQILKDFE